MDKLFFLLSGEHKTLPYAELKAILEAEKIKFEELDRSTQVIRIEANPKCIENIRLRAALTRVCCIEFFNCVAKYNEILSYVSKVPFENFINDGETFCVRIKRIRGASPHISCLMLEKEIGGEILKKKPKVKVNLENPDKMFFGVLTDGRFIFGLKVAEIDPGEFIERRPSRKPFFHPTAMPAKLARCMVNLARATRGSTVLDPFCGTSSILIEAGLIGCKIIGLDVKKKMIYGSKENLSYFKLKPEALILGDALKPPLKCEIADFIVTDPPYGRSATTMGLKVESVFESFFSNTIEVLSRGGFICVASPSRIGVSKFGVDYGLKHLESHFVYVHGGLTREISVFLKP